MNVQLRRYLPLFGIAVAIFLFYWFELTLYLTFETLKENHKALKQLVQTYPWGTPLVFMAIYATVAALSIPAGIYLSIFSGVLFPQPYCTIYIVLGATAGATGIFLAAKRALGDFLEKKAGDTIKKMQKGFQENEVNYLLFLRFVPLFPFWLVNIAPAFFNVSLRTFMWTTAVGIVPGSYAYAQAGVGLSSIFEKGESFSIESVFNRDVKIALVALGLFALLPVVIKKLRRKHD